MDQKILKITSSFMSEKDIILKIGNISINATFINNNNCRKSGLLCIVNKNKITIESSTNFFNDMYIDKKINSYIINSNKTPDGFYAIEITDDIYSIYDYELFLKNMIDKKYIKDEKCLDDYRITDNIKLCKKCWSRKIVKESGRKNSCGICAQSKKEWFIYKYLKSNKYEFITQYEFSDLLTDNNNPMKLDFCVFIDNKKYIVEYHGVQHFKSTDFFGGKDTFEKQQKRDDKKRSYMIDKEINYIELYQDDNFLIEKELMDFIGGKSIIPKKIKNKKIISKKQQMEIEQKNKEEKKKYINNKKMEFFNYISSKLGCILYPQQQEELKVISVPLKKDGSNTISVSKINELLELYSIPVELKSKRKMIKGERMTVWKINKLNENKINDII